MLVDIEGDTCCVAVGDTIALKQVGPTSASNGLRTQTLPDYSHLKVGIVHYVFYVNFVMLKNLCAIPFLLFVKKRNLNLLLGMR